MEVSRGRWVARTCMVCMVGVHGRRAWSVGWQGERTAAVVVAHLYAACYHAEETLFASARWRVPGGEQRATSGEQRRRGARTRWWRPRRVSTGTHAHAHAENSSRPHAARLEVVGSCVTCRWPTLPRCPELGEFVRQVARRHRVDGGARERAPRRLVREGAVGIGGPTKSQVLQRSTNLQRSSLY